MATRRRLVRLGKCGGGRFSLPAANAGADRRDHQQQPADGAERPKQPVIDFDPAKQRGGADQQRRDQKNARGGEQPGGDRIGCGGAGGLVGPVAQIGIASPA